MRFRSLLPLLAAAALVAAGPAGATGIGPDDLQLSATGPAGSTTTDAVTPDVAHDPVAQRYLAVWSADETDGEFAVYGRLLTGAGGVPAGPAFRISPAGAAGSDCREPAVAFAASHGVYLVVWSGDTDHAGAAEIHGRLVAADGSLPGAPFRLSSMGTVDTDPAFDAVNPDVTFSPDEDAFIVVWSGDDDTGGMLDGRFEVYAQFVAPDGTETGTDDLRLTVAGGTEVTHDVLRPAVAAAPGTGRWYTAFEVDIIADGVYDPDVWVVGATGGVGDASAVLVGPMGGLGDGLSAWNPDLVWSPAQSEFVCVWDGESPARGIHAQRFSSAGVLVGGPVAITAAAPPAAGGAWAECLDPALVVDPGTGDWFVAWRGAPTSGGGGLDFEVWAVSCDAAGTPLSFAATALSAMDPSLGPVAGAGRPALALNPNHGYKLAVWSGDLDTTPGDEHEIFAQSWADGVSGVEDTPLATAFALHGARPNPFNPRTSIAFDLPRAAPVNLAVYDVSGRLVRTLLADAPQPAGPGSVVWDGRDGSGRHAPSGVYLYRLETPTDRAAGRMTLLK